LRSSTCIYLSLMLLLELSKLSVELNTYTIVIHSDPKLFDLLDLHNPCNLPSLYSTVLREQRYQLGSYSSILGFAKLERVL